MWTKMTMQIGNVMLYMLNSSIKSIKAVTHVQLQLFKSCIDAFLHCIEVVPTNVRRSLIPLMTSSNEVVCCRTRVVVVVVEEVLDYGVEEEEEEEEENFCEPICYQRFGSIQRTLSLVLILWYAYYVGQVFHPPIQFENVVGSG
ncbi:hypothetical protein LR48_Vigan08g038100 [Vigna angularis]|uniref:Uncharacterized protein n=1 Tax=Phaseolus angularis TaxID=3914 RepID=A0A0L9V4D1_PHAAN|nr:hypothetical protein LR48_Vigan08g038100 [Vigna angularis]